MMRVGESLRSWRSAATMRGKPSAVPGSRSRSLRGRPEPPGPRGQPGPVAGGQSVPEIYKMGDVVDRVDLRIFSPTGKKEHSAGRCHGRWDCGDHGFCGDTAGGDQTSHGTKGWGLIPDLSPRRWQSTWFGGAHHPEPVEGQSQTGYALPSWRPITSNVRVLSDVTPISWREQSVGWAGCPSKSK